MAQIVADGDLRVVFLLGLSEATKPGERTWTRWEELRAGSDR
jgi:hypothetical protein